MLIKIEAIVREEKYEEVKEALNKIQVNGITVLRSWDAAYSADTKRSSRIRG